MNPLKRLALLALCLPAAAQAECRGANLFTALPPAEQAEIRAATDAAPFARGLLWQATRGDESITLLGTYHFDDPRHDAIMARVTPLLDAATTLLVEAGPAEEAALKSDLAKNPALMVSTNGPTLPESLPAKEWEALSAAMNARGMPAFMAAKLRPWYVTMLLALPPCAMADQAALASGGLDQRLIRHATDRALPVAALEPHDTVLRMFDTMPPADQLAMIRSALATEAQAEDYSATLATAYFDEDARLIWELSRHLALKLPDYGPEQVARDFDAMETALMTSRNRAWSPVLQAAGAKGPVFAAFGALHLSGENGVLALLQADGWKIERLPL
ncbi:TraB/GumN family protein [Paragemmobacter straminiformis]|uniref:TraB/GumN family protein n=1 Tax=Paragemmobacter straminiformis TaxID=2045119 RepID=A0A842I666_9RHOB|nr:TraB/GumN family protein [Gemmobacter straminiformis]MBC2834867.1 TraB/GumN family protein [Gemmobacter straminiformis]